MITGSVEPNDDECDWPSDEEKEDEQLSVKNPAVNTLHNRDLLYERFEDNDQNFLKKFFLPANITKKFKRESENCPWLFFL